MQLNGYKEEWYVLFLISLDLQLGVHVTSPHQVQYIVLSAESVYKQRAMHDFQAALTQPGQVSRGTKSDGLFHSVKFATSVL